MSGVKEKFEEITTGWKNVVFKDPEVELVANQRALICAQCPFNKHNVCSKCGCPLTAKTRSPKSKCPEGKW